ncbi:MAG: four-carbon acid sugar kinase family protein [Verrucomicrobiae bacterium]|nr:four-carbon acid sugar kinase family protein [Verrucomicrobiae bacterium]
MIVVIADDFSGAAELAGIAWRYGLRAEIWIDLPDDSSRPVDVDLVAIDTDTRLASPVEAAKRVGTIAKAVSQRWQAQWIYKKTDSVLRGNIAAELAALREALGSERVWWVPANPSKGRVIRDGRYFIGDEPLDRTLFAHDPTHPIRESHVRKQAALELCPEVIVPDQVTSHHDLDHILSQAGPNDLLAGAADFFETGLKRRIAIQQGSVADSTLLDQHRAAVIGGRWILCGSQAAWAQRKRTFQERDWPVLTLDRAAEWESALGQAGSAVLLGIGEIQGEPERLCAQFAEQVAATLEAGAVAWPASILMEGGATAVAVMRRFGASRFRVRGEIGPGAPWIEALDRALPLMCPKPGSYPWPIAAFEVEE